MALIARIAGAEEAAPAGFMLRPPPEPEPTAEETASALQRLLGG
jgi:hypothetical protein